MIKSWANNIYLHTSDFGVPSSRKSIEPNRSGSFKCLHPPSYFPVVGLFAFCIN